MPLRRSLIATACGFGFATLAYAQIDAQAWLKQSAHAAGKLNYAGMVLYQRGSNVEMFRFARITEASGDIERLVTLDGAPREIIRQGDQVTTFFHDTRTVRVEPRGQQVAFPYLSSAQIEALTRHYVASAGPIEKVAGFDAQQMNFTPRDTLRYAQQLWAELRTGLLIKMRVFDENQNIVEQVVFTDLQMGSRVTRAHVRPSFARKPDEWRTETFTSDPSGMQETGWLAQNLPPGYVKVREGLRSLPGQSAPVPHLVFSDGFATVSVFVEPVRGASPVASAPVAAAPLAQSVAPRLENGVAAATSNSTSIAARVDHAASKSMVGDAGLADGASKPESRPAQSGTHIFRRQVNEFVVTAVGETPPAAVRAIANSLAKR